GVGSIEPVSQASVAFPASGTVASIAVKVGDTVAAGQTLAGLDTRSLTQSLDQQQATLAQAQLTLSKALAGQSSGTSPGSGTGRTANASQSAAVSGTGASAAILAVATTANPTLTRLQQAVVADQAAVDAALATAAAALATATTDCAITPPATLPTNVALC